MLSKAADRPQSQMGEDTWLMTGRRRTSLQILFVGIACFVVLTSFMGAFSSSADHRTRTRRRLLISEDDATPMLTRKLASFSFDQFLPSFLRSRPRNPPVGYSQPYINGEPEYYCTHTWFHPCSAEDNATGPPLHMIQPGRLSDEDQDLIRVTRKFQVQREVASERMPVKKVAFMFLTKGPMPFAPLWERFFAVSTPKPATRDVSAAGGGGGPFAALHTLEKVH